MTTIRAVVEINNKASGFGLSDLTFDPKTGALVAVRVSYDEAKRYRRGLIAWEAGTYRQIHYWEDPELSSDHRRNWSELLFSENGSRLVAVARSATLCAVFGADDYRFLREFPICRQETYALFRPWRAKKRNSLFPLGTENYIFATSIRLTSKNIPVFRTRKRSVSRRLVRKIQENVGFSEAAVVWNRAT